jgi:hypothetical protein
VRRTFKDDEFAKRARKAGISDSSLARAIHEVENGLVDANLGGGIVKKRIAREGAGKSRGYRTIIAFQKPDRAFSCISSLRTIAAISTGKIWLT